MSTKRESHCLDCGLKFIEENRVYSGRKTNNRCRECLSRRMQELRRQREEVNPELKRRRLQSAKESGRKNLYGLTQEEYIQMVRDQGGVCAICKQSDDYELSVDHDHSTGEIRALLCRKCNSAIALVRENVSILSSMIEYLREYQHKYENHSNLMVIGVKQDAS